MSALEHASFASETDKTLLTTLQNTSRPMTTRDVTDTCDHPRSTVYDALTRLHDAGHIDRKKHGNTIEWTARSQTSQTTDDPIGSSIDIPDDPSAVDGKDVQSLREDIGLSALETTAAGNIYLSELTAWENGDADLSHQKKKAVLTFLSSNSQ